MIYSADINKVCGLCRSADKTEDEDKMRCARKGAEVGVSDAGCKKFEYDIFKKRVHRKKRLKTEFSAEDFSLD